MASTDGPTYACCGWSLHVGHSPECKAALAEDGGGERIWRSIESAPTGWGNFFLVRPKGIHRTTGLPFVPTVVQQAEGSFFVPHNEIEPLYFGQNEEPDSPLKTELEWHPLPSEAQPAAPLSDDARRLAEIRDRLRSRQFMAQFSYEDVACVNRLLDAAQAEIARLLAERSRP